MRLFLHTVLLLAVLCISAVTSVPTGFIEYLPGSLSIIISAPHGGQEKPDEIPNRVSGCYIRGACVYRHGCGVKNRTMCRVTTVTDLYTQDMARGLRDSLKDLTGHYPHTIISLLKRTKLDPNRDKSEGAFGVALAEQAWEEFHDHMDTAKASMSRGVVFDLHGNGKPEQWVMLGYILSGADLKDGGFLYNQTSIRALVETEGVAQFDNVLRGVNSFGAYLEATGFPAVPSPTNHDPGKAFFFEGGYITKRHGSMSGGQVDAIQIESPGTFRKLRLTEYTKGLAIAINGFYNKYYRESQLQSIISKAATTACSHQGLVVVTVLSCASALLPKHMYY